ncbi:MAG: TlpA disulfide reductase family protein, partial [Dokdonella sp.]|uniref:TlpA family protein disulfide reductase n=1 Tax=Dokdonella sp. TaxID=2291710 RepID=UPI003267CE92
PEISMRILLYALFFLAGGTALAQERAIAWVGTNGAGTVVRFDPDHLPRPALILFWATWCPYCKALMPHLQKVRDAAGADHLDIYAIDIKDDGDPRAELRERGLDFTLITDGDAIAAQYGVKGTPTLLLVNAQGSVAYRMGSDSPDTTEATLREKLHLHPASPAKR